MKTLKEKKAYPPELTELYSYDQLKKEIYEILIDQNIIKKDEIECFDSNYKISSRDKNGYFILRIMYIM